MGGAGKGVGETAWEIGLSYAFAYTTVLFLLPPPWATHKPLIAPLRMPAQSSGALLKLRERDSLSRLFCLALTCAALALASSARPRLRMERGTHLRPLGP